MAGITIRDESYQAPGFSLEHERAVMATCKDLRDAADAGFAMLSIVWGNYPELTIEETLSAALDGRMDQCTADMFRSEWWTHRTQEQR